MNFFRVEHFHKVMGEFFFIGKLMTNEKCDLIYQKCATPLEHFTSGIPSFSS